ncbi:MAG TPA: division/cell wall cluster transcriptional repressor MraZ [Candidatus Methylacidiphilales bacterium]|nr:division/cell wall cluster transcriptional repressor MraZ [Candidatus Methylacidiphilales bacterium]
MSNETTRASYTDTFDHAFDGKGRITVPAEWRGGSYESRLFILPSTEQCLRIYPESWLSSWQEKLKTLKDGDPVRQQALALASVAQSTTWDQQGRIMVKEKLRQKAGLKKEAMLVGQLDHFEIWDKAVWEKRPAAAITVEEALRAMGL